MKRCVILRSCALLLSFLLLFCFAGCSSGKLRPSANANKVVATAGEMEITYDELYFLAMSRAGELCADNKDALKDPAVREQLENEVWGMLLNESHALRLIARDYGVSLDSGEIAENVQALIDNDIEENFGGDRDAYIEGLNAAFLTERYLRTDYAVQDYLAVEVLRVMLERGELDDSDEAARDFIWGENMLRVEQVLIQSSNYVSADAAKAKAEELRASVVAEGDNAARVSAMRKAMQYSTYFGTDDGMYVARGEMDATFEEIAFALPLYGVSEVVAVEGGFYFIMNLPKEESYVAQNFEALKQKSYFIHLNDMVDEKLAGMTLEKTKYGASLDLTDLDPIDANGGQTVFVILWVSVGVVAVIGLGMLATAFLKKRRSGTVKK